MAATANAATIRGTPGDDVLIGTPQADKIIGYGGNDTIYPGGGANVVYGGPGDDVIVSTTGTGRSERIYCGKGYDVQHDFGSALTFLFFCEASV